MTESELKRSVVSIFGGPLLKLGFKGPEVYRNESFSFEIAYVNKGVGLSLEVNMLDRAMSVFVFNAETTEGFPHEYRDSYGKIQKRYLNEILQTLGLVNRKQLHDQIQLQRKLAIHFEQNAEAICNEVTTMLINWVSYLIEHQDFLFGMTKIEGAPSNFYK